jgi:hypothetical protein
MRGTNHLWNFMESFELKDFQSFKTNIGLSTDLETATDYANPLLARWLFDQIIDYFSYGEKD